MFNCILVGIGGFIGSVSRYLIGLLPIETGGGFPIKTLAINTIGSFFISVVVILASKDKGLNPQAALMLKTGICGGFTTFSTFAFESADLMKSGQMMTAFIYICLSVILGVSAVFAAQIMVK